MIPSSHCKGTDGDTEAINQISTSLQRVHNEVAPYDLWKMNMAIKVWSLIVLRGRMETRLITKILSFWLSNILSPFVEAC